MLAEAKQTATDDLCSQTYLAALFTGQEAVCPGHSASFLRYNCRFCASTQPGRSFFAADLFCPNRAIRNSPRRDFALSTTSAAVTPSPPSCAFFTVLYHDALLFLPSTLSSYAFTVAQDRRDVSWFFSPPRSFSLFLLGTFHSSP